MSRKKSSQIVAETWLQKQAVVNFYMQRLMDGVSKEEAAGHRNFLAKYGTPLEDLLGQLNRDSGVLKTVFSPEEQKLVDEFKRMISSKTVRMGMVKVNPDPPKKMPFLATEKVAKGSAQELFVTRSISGEDTVFELSPPYYDEHKKRAWKYVVVTTNHGRELMVFPSDVKGKILSWTELWGRNGKGGNAEALNALGYRIR